MHTIFYPESIVVIGVSEREDNLAANIVRNLRAFGYSGALYAVGLRPGVVAGIPIATSVAELPTGIGLAVILTPAATVPGLLDACGAHGIRRAVIETGGFGEYSEAGRQLEAELISVARRWEIRFVGPNCISAINMENGLCLPFIRLDPTAVKRGPVSVLAQSGGVSITYMVLLSEMGLGVNKVVSMGNKSNLDEVDYLNYLLDDPGTRVICLYLESVEEGRRLIELARAAPKPIIVQKANTTTASAQVAFSHTAALASDDRVLSAALAQAGIPAPRSFASAATLAQGFCLPPVRGNRLVIASRSGGHAVVAADLAAAAGFDLAPIPADFLAHVQSLNRADVITLTNPLDLGAITDFRISGQVMQEALRRLDMDALLLIQTFGMGTETALTLELGRRVQQTAGELGKPVAFCAFSHREQVDRLRAELDIPVFAEVEGAIEALAASRDHYARQARAQSLALPAPSEARPHEVEALLCRDGALGADLALGLLAAYGVPTAEWAVVDSVEGALVAAGAIGYPVALKVLSPDIVHKSDVGAISLDIEDRETLRGAFTDLLARVRGQAPDLDLRGVLVRRMAHGGREVILGGRRDPAFGPVVMFGLGGIYAEVFRDVTFRLAPLSRADAEEMVAEVRSVGLLRGARGQAASDIDAVVEALLALSELMLACPEVSEIDVNPLVVFERGAVAVDSRAVIAVPVT